MTSGILFPNDPGYFDNPRIVDVFDYYDGPKIFSFLTKTNDFYLAYFCEQAANSSTWLYFPTNNFLLEKFTQDQVTIREFFKLSLIAYLVTVNGQNQVVGSPRRSMFEEIPEEYVPDEEVRLESPVSELTLKINKDGISPASFQESAVTKVISGFHRSLKKVMKELKKHLPEMENYQSTPLMALTGVAPGSVELKLKPMDYNPLLAKAVETIQDVISETNLANVHQDVVTTVRQEMYSLAPNPRSKVFNFDSIELKGVIASTEKRVDVSVAVNKEVRERLALHIKKVEDLATNVLLCGLVRTWDMDEETFFLRNIDLDSRNKLQLKQVKCQLDLEGLPFGQEITEEEILEFMTSETRVEVSGRYIHSSDIIDVATIGPAKQLKIR
ncbi:MAG: hypothetical protein A2X94_00795 [Bdellovibrionales bacterium GWB1_55_8]|nr:MAG: hypothetical protein A2X94_00795 [Bdellovibrionales bacterium GWB1_55_8]